MSLAPGQRLGGYEIVGPLGAGGMGEVYRARDPRLDREVAIKVLPEHLLESADARSRFQTETRAVAALSQPNILAIHDVGEENGIAFAVMELLEGGTLAERLADGPLPLRKALELARQMAEGLAAAHDKGIVHRDLKPSNVFLTADGRLKILDFGLAKSSVADQGGDTLAATVGESTDPGTVLGTVGYMSPEQVRGETVDSRSDIFSFGAVLHEMLTGQRPFLRDTAVETMSAILREDPPDSSSVNPLVPPAVDRILHRCLEKAPEQRFQSARDLAFALSNSGESTSRGHAPLGATAPPPSRRPWLIGAGLLVVGAILGTLVGLRLASPPVPEPVRVFPLTNTGSDWSPTPSPDGRMIAFVSSRDGTDRIWLRQMQGGNEVALTEGSDAYPSFSPDGSMILYLHREDQGRYGAYRIPVVGGQPRRITGPVGGADWSPDGTRIAFARIYGEDSEFGTLVGTADVQSGREMELVRIPQRLFSGLSWSPDGRWITGFAGSVVNNAPESRLLAVDAETGKIEVFLRAPVTLSAAGWHPHDGSLIVGLSTSLLGDLSSPLGKVVRLEPGSGRTTPLFWVQSVYGGGSDFARFEYLNDTEIVFDEILWRGTLSALPLQGGRVAGEGVRLTSGNSRDRQPAYSPDGNLVAFSSNRSGNLDLWTLNPSTGEVRQLTDDTADDWDPAFSADGERILWSSNRAGNLEIWTARADGSAPRQLTHDGEDAENPTQTPDGEWVVYSSSNPERNGIWKVRTDGSEEVRIAAGDFFLPEVSPSGRYVAYAINDGVRGLAQVLVADLETGEQVFTANLPFFGYQNVVSSGRSRWLPDESALVFVGTDTDGGTVGLQIQDFRPGTDTEASRRWLVEPSAGGSVESFGISPDGSRITVARIEQFRTVKLAQGLPAN